jgi:hypothetical protein
MRNNTEARICSSGIQVRIINVFVIAPCVFCRKYSHSSSCQKLSPGGALGLFERGNDLLSILTEIAPAKRLDVYGKGNGIDIRQPAEK